MSDPIVILGTGAFGRALGSVLEAAGSQTIYVAKEWGPGEVALAQGGAQVCTLKTLPPGPVQGVVVAAPTAALESVGPWIRAHLAPSAWVLCAAKGIHPETLELPHELLERALGRQTYALSGPSFAAEILGAKPTSVVIAGRHEESAKAIALCFRTALFRPYVSLDLVGVQTGGALKNVIAIAAGALDGLGLGSNARAALLTRGLGEIAQIGLARGGKLITFLGLSGMGDLILTATGELSRNRRLGMLVGQGLSPKEALSSMGGVVEGFTTSQSAARLAHRHGLDCPILVATYRVLHEGLPLADAQESLLGRQGKGEFDWTRS